MRVITDYSDGQYSMRPFVEEDWALDCREHARAFSVEISDEEWKEYEKFLDMSAKWYSRIHVLDEQAHTQVEDKK